MDKKYQIRIVVNTGKPYPVMEWSGDWCEEWPMGVSYDGVTENSSVTTQIEELAENAAALKANAKTADEKWTAHRAVSAAEDKIFKLMASLRVA